MDLKDGDIRELIGKYNFVEKRLEEAMSTVERIGDLESKIVGLGIHGALYESCKFI